MKLLFDARYIRTDFHDGVSRYGHELGVALAKLTAVTFIICDDKQLDLLPAGCEYIKIHPPTSVKEPLTALYLNTYHPDVVFTPLQTMGSVGRKYKLILTLQDVIYYKFPSAPRNLPLHIRGLWWLFHQAYWPQRLILQGANAVATVSYTSKKYIEQFRLTKRPITVIYNAPQPTPAIKVADTPSKNLVYMGSFMPYKNVETMIEGMRYIPDNFTLHLLSKVSSGRKAELKALVPEGTKVIFYNGVSDEKYFELLASAYALVTASRIEGFGLPIVEAGKIGVPVVISDIDIFHEVAASTALYFDPTSPEEFAKQVMVLGDGAVRAKKIAAGKSQAAKFSWDNSARVLLKLIENLDR